MPTPLELQAHYDDYYADPRLAEWRRLGAVCKADNIVALCAPVPHRTVLDLGCGDGAVLQELGDRGFFETAYGAEISSSALAALARRRIPGFVEGRPFDGTRVPFDDGAFDLAVLSHVVEHVDEPRRLLREAARVARHVFVEVPLEHTARLPADYRPDAVGHINFYTAKTIRRLVQTCDFEVLAQRVTNTSADMLAFQRGRRGRLLHAVRASALRLVPRLAQRVFVYHAALLCRSPAAS